MSKVTLIGLGKAGIYKVIFNWFHKNSDKILLKHRVSRWNNYNLEIPQSHILLI
jgi:hypothetical protein